MPNTVRADIVQTEGVREEVGGLGFRLLLVICEGIGVVVGFCLSVEGHVLAVEDAGIEGYLHTVVLLQLLLSVALDGLLYVERLFGISCGIIADYRDIHHHCSCLLISSVVWQQPIDTHVVLCDFDRDNLQ